MTTLARIADPVEEGIKTFRDIKEKIIDKIDERKRDNVGSRLRARAREVPEMMLELGLVPAISFCLAKAGIKNVIEVAKAIERPDSKSLDNLKEEELAYAIYSYAVLKYLTIIAGKVDDAKLSIEDIVDKDQKEVQGMLIKYLDALVKAGAGMQLYSLLLPYLLEFKRLCEAVYEAVKRVER